MTNCSKSPISQAVHDAPAPGGLLLRTQAVGGGRRSRRRPALAKRTNPATPT